jgi:hypothetical protein
MVLPLNLEESLEDLITDSLRFYTRTYFQSPQVVIPSNRFAWLNVENLLDVMTYTLQAVAVYGYCVDRTWLNTGHYSVAVAGQLVLLWTRLQRYIR